MINLFENMADVFALANNIAEFIRNVLKEGKENSSDKPYAKLASSGDGAKLASSGNYAQLASSGDGAQLANSGNYVKLASSGDGAQLANSGNYVKLASSGYGAKLASSGDGAKLASSGDGAQLANSGNYVKLASSGDGAQLANSGNYVKLASSGYGAQLASSGDGAKLASSGDGAQLASSGDGAKLASSGDGAQLANSGNYAKLASSGDGAKIESTGENVIISAIGAFSMIKAKKGSWITLAEYKKGEPYCVKTGFVDGIKIKEDTWYSLYNTRFTECVEFDGIKSYLIAHKGNVYKVVNFGGANISYVVTDGECSSHGDTVKQAKADLIYKISNRDTSQYKELTKDSVVTKTEAIKMYRIITGACEAGTKHFVNGLEKTKSEYKVSELIELTKGQYGNGTFKNFFEERKNENS